MNESVAKQRRLRLLRDLNTDDLLQAAGLTRLSRLVPEVRRLFDAPASLLARRLDDFDQEVAAAGAASAARGFLRRLGQGVEARGVPVLSQGPRLFVSNHPGLGDALALLATLNQPDLRIVARDRTFLRALPTLARSLILVPEAGPSRVLGLAEAHLRSGGAVLTFPAGRIEPDPAWFDASESWSAWSASTALLARRVEGLRVQPVQVADVRLKDFVHPWAARWRRHADREWTAAVLQLAYQVLGRPRLHGIISVTVGEPLPGTLWARGGRAADPLAAALAHLAKR